MPAAVSAPEVAPSSSRSSRAARAHGTIGGGQERDDDLGEAALERLEEELARHERRALAGGIGERLPDPGIIEEKGRPKAPGDGEAAHQQVIAGGGEPFAEADQAARAVDEAVGVSAPQSLGEPPPALERESPRSGSARRAAVAPRPARRRARAGRSRRRSTCRPPGRRSNRAAGRRARAVRGPRARRGRRARARATGGARRARPRMARRGDRVHGWSRGLRRRRGD